MREQILLLMIDSILFGLQNKQYMKSHQTKEKFNSTRPKSSSNFRNAISFRTFSSKKLQKSRQINPTNLLTGIYKGKPIEQTQDKMISYRGMQMQIQDIIKLKLRPSPKTCKTPEQLLQQNIQLKSQINKLREEMLVLKGQINVNYKRKEDIQLGKQIQIQYQKDLYWANNEKSFRVLGMRQQYQKLKKQYNQKIKQNKQLKIKVAQTGITEAKIYIQQLEKQLKKLINIIQIDKNSGIQNQARGHYRSVSKNEEPSKRQYESRNQHNKNENTITYQQIRTHKTLKNNEQQLSQLKRCLKQRQDKIYLLQKLIIAKDNRQHSVTKKIRKIEKQNQNLVNQYNILLEESKIIKTKLQLQGIKLKNYYTEQINRINRQNKKQLIQKDRKIKQLQKLTKILEQQTPTNKNKINNTSLISKSVGGLNMRSTRKASHDYGNNLLIVQEQDFIPSRRYASQQNQKLFQKFQSDDDNSQVLIKIDIKQPKRANKKHSELSERLRKVQFSEVQPIGQLLRFRMIGHKIQSSNLKQYFMRKLVKTEQSERSLSKKQRQLFEVMEQVDKEEDCMWQDQYITMKQVIQILKKVPFSLNEKQSYTLARYMVQDCEQQFVYCDMNNQNKRQIVKSIIKTIIGEYRLIEQNQYHEFNQMMFRYSLNLKSTLNSYYPSGIIPKIKLLQIVKGIGADLNSKQRQLMIAKLSLLSNSLNQLVYNSLFQPST